MAPSEFRGLAQAWTPRWREAGAAALVAILLGASMAFLGIPEPALASSVLPSSVAPPPAVEPILTPPTPAAWRSLGNRTEGVAGHGLVYDSAAGVFILFGGTRGGWAFSNATWTYDAASGVWTNVTPLGSPSPRAQFGMAYDSRADRVILFGGQTAAGESDETWVFDLASDQWTLRLPSGKPLARSDFSMAYDSGSDRTILYGGSFLSDAWADTWSYDYPSNTWTMMTPSTYPGIVGGASMAYVPSAGRVVLFGGYTFGRWFQPIWHDKTFAYDYANDTWTDRNPIVHPLGRGRSTMSFDSSAGQLLLFGGTLGAGLFSEVVNETWAYDYRGNNWTSATPALGPSARSLAAMAFDPVAGRSVLVGGSGGGWIGPGENDTWAYRFGAAPPAAPRIVLAAAEKDQVTLRWEAPISDGGSLVTNYSLYRGEAPGQEAFLVTSGLDLTYIDRAVTLGTRECYRVAAVNAVGTGAWSNEVCATPADVPSAPRGLVATAGLARITLRWEAPSFSGGLDVVGYDVYRGLQGEESFFVGLGPVLTFEDGYVTNGSTIYYRVAAVNNAGIGPMSNEASATVPTTPSAPQALGGAGGDGIVRLTWALPLSTGGMDVTGYKVYRREAAGSWTPFATVGLLYAFADITVVNGRTYYYRVSALNAVGEGPPSEEVSVEPLVASDIVPPVIAITSPADGAVIASSSATVTGIASDNVLIEKVELSTDGTTWVTANGTTSWSGSVALTEGSTTVYARATDASGNVKEVSVTVLFSGASKVPDPVLVGVLFVAVVASTVGGFIVWTHRARGRRPRAGDGDGRGK